ncbi:MAG: DUF1778 domain-containing protein [Pseudomonadota bacterium]
MLTFTDSAAAIDEPKTARMEQRTKARVKAEIQHAAALLGVDETGFVTSVAYERAREVVRDHQQTVVSAEEYGAILAGLDGDPAPTDALKKAVSNYRELVADPD